MIELIVAGGVLALVFLGIGAMMSGSVTNTKLLRLETALTAKAQEFVDACRVLQFGAPSDAAPATSSIDEIFDGDPYMGGTAATLHAVRRYASSQSTAGEIHLPTSKSAIFPDGFEAKGTFIIRFAQGGKNLLTRALVEDPTITLKLKGATLANDDAIRVSILFQDDRTQTERLLMATVMTPESSAGGAA